ncbi:hypothetical protein HYH02_010257 [Chlamydomonas schloesseri]|uniref:Condensin complex subunit 1 C-terminal domain-containing protein n=1 Tax=Chlamydomonas schloesseri TaxID=2026947 RepID=A0A835T8K2_9CHLO|nr:hypothetical protein HYH02_010257 [Chlamydomonas schloesseri]|eukprot:KAG2440678.1 hypothetical protein HYH02_010257 [Chlamydomonas schloesseri]
MSAAALSQLAEVASGELTGRRADAALTEAAEAVQELRNGAGWSALEGEEVSAVALTRALGDLLKQESAAVRGNAASIYVGLLALRGAPVGTLCEPYAFAAFIQCLKGICLPTKKAPANGDAATQQQDGEAEAAGPAVSPVSLLEDLGLFLKHHSMRGNSEMFSLLLDALVDMTGSAVSAAAGAAVAGSKAGKRGGSKHGGASVSDAAFALLPVALDSRHGHVAQTLAVVANKLVPTLVGADGSSGGGGGGGGGKRGGGGQAVDRRGAALSLINSLLSTQPAAKPCRLALMRQLCLRAPDKADCRATAVASVQTMVSSCDGEELRGLCVFLHRLSRTQKTGHRMVAVEMAGALLASLPAPFGPDGEYKHMLDGSRGAGDELEAPWSALCMGVLVARTHDKSASVRGKALTCLAEVAQSFAKDLAAAAQRDPGLVGGCAAAAFVPALCASRHICVQVTAPKGAGKAKAGAAAEGGAQQQQEADDEDEDEDEEMEDAEGQEDGGEAAARVVRPPKEAEVTAAIPAKVSLDLGWLKALCHARCRDDKAAVRKAALSLLEAALELCAATGATAGGGDGDAPSPQDVQVLEDATADTLVSVRKAALQSVCSLALCYPHHPGLAGVWARCVLPMVRDPETAIQDTVLDRLVALLLDPLAKLASGSSTRGGGASGSSSSAAAVLFRGFTPAQQAVVEEVRRRLAALAAMGRGASGCLGRALAAMSARKLLRAPQVAAGLEAFLLYAAIEEAEAAAAAPPAPRGRGNKGAGAGDPAWDAERERRRAARDQREGAWLVLVEIAAQDPSAPSWQFLQRRWEELRGGKGGSGGGAGGAAAQEGAMLLWVISHAASRFPAADAADLASGLLQAVLGFNLPCAAVAAHLAALHRLTTAAGGGSGSGGAEEAGEGEGGEVGPPTRWCARVVAAAEEVLGAAMEARGSMSAAQAARTQLALFTLGEVALLRELPARALTGGVAVKVQALTSLSSLRGRGAGPSQVGAAAAGGGGSSAAAAATAVCAQAWTALGKLCMVDEGLAKKCVPLMVQEMSTSPSPAVRSVLLVAVADMVVQYTGLADGHVARLAAAVRDPHELVRRQALALLANLLLRDYVKWRGALVHRFLLALVDESAGVRQLATYLLGDSLAAKAPLLAYNHFIESLFVLNDCTSGVHASSRGGGGSGSELAAELALHSAMEGGGGGFHLKGSSPIMRAKRDIIYTSLLRRMSPEHRFAASAKLVAEVLGGVVDGLLPLTGGAAAAAGTGVGGAPGGSAPLAAAAAGGADEVLGDALRLLACKDMKINTSKFGAGAADDDAEPSATQEDATRARGKLVGAMMRKHLAESVVPLMVELRYLLQAQKHPLLGSLMLCLASLLRDYKSEVEDILVADKQLAREILHDLKHYEALAKTQQAQHEAAMAAALAGPGGGGGGAGAGGSGGSGGGGGSAPQPQRAVADAAEAGGGAGAGAGPSAGQGMPPPRAPATGDRQRRRSVLDGVEPRATPLAAQVLLATASKRGRQQQQAQAGQAQAGQPPLSRPHTPYAGAAAGLPAGAKTPAAALGGAGAPPGTAMRTPRTGLLGTGLRGKGAGMMMMMGGFGGVAPSPAPLSARAQRAPPQGAAGVLLSPAALAAGRTRADGAAAAEEETEPIRVVLPLPDPEAAAAQAAQQRSRPLGPHNPPAGGEAAAEGAAAGTAVPHRTPPAALAAAVRAARKAAAAVTDGEEPAQEQEPTDGSGAGAGQSNGAPTAMETEQEAQADQENAAPASAAAGAARPTRGAAAAPATAAGKAAGRGAKVKTEPGASEAAAVKVKEEAAAGGRGSRASKRRLGNA